MKKLSSLFILISGVITGWLADWMLFRKQVQGEADTLRSELKIAQGQAKDMERRAESHSAEIATLNKKLTVAQNAVQNTAALEAKLDDAKEQIATLELSLMQARQARVKAENALAQREEAATKAAHAAAMTDGDPDEDNEDGEPDNLQRIEGIGPKTKQLLYENGVLTFAHLASGTPEELAAMLKESGFRGVISTDTWPEQAALAADGKWDELQKLQDELDGGRRK